MGSVLLIRSWATFLWVCVSEVVKVSIYEIVPVTILVSMHPAGLSGIDST